MPPPSTKPKQQQQQKPQQPQPSQTRYRKARRNSTTPVAHKAAARPSMDEDDEMHDAQDDDEYSNLSFNEDDVVNTYSQQSQPQFKQGAVRAARNFTAQEKPHTVLKASNQQLFTEIDELEFVPLFDDVHTSDGHSPAQQQQVDSGDDSSEFDEIKEDSPMQDEQDQLQQEEEDVLEASHPHLARTLKSIEGNSQSDGGETQNEMSLDEWIDAGDKLLQENATIQNYFKEIVSEKEGRFHQQMQVVQDHRKSLASRIELFKEQKKKLAKRFAVPIDLIGDGVVATAADTNDAASA
ncbi:hypothetical protein ACM66B_002569 [Microbotryomycetes sp. NB124-2]